MASADPSKDVPLKATQVEALVSQSSVSNSTTAEY